MTSHGPDEWFRAMFEPTWTWPNFMFGQLFMWIGANNGQIWLPIGYMSDSEQCSNRLETHEEDGWARQHMIEKDYKVFEMYLNCIWNIKYFLNVFKYKYKYFSFWKAQIEIHINVLEKKYLNTFKYKYFCIWPHVWFEPIWTWPYFTFGQLFMWIGANNYQIWLPMG